MPEHAPPPHLHPDHAAHGCAGAFTPERAQRHAHDKQVFQTLLKHHTAISREVVEIEGGIEAVTTSSEPRIVKLLHDHAQEMHRRMQEGFGLRHWDAAFAEMFAQADKVQMQLELLADGVRVRETADEPNVVVLIRAHGAVVSSFVREGGRVAAKESPLPEAYRRILR